MATRETIRARLLTAVPTELQTYTQWVVYKCIPRNGKSAKIPFDPKTGRLASVTDPAAWGTFSEALRTFQTGHYAGIGFVFTGEDPFVGIDLDGCRNPVTMEVARWALSIVRQLCRWYWEVSPSGTGLHGIGCGILPPGHRRKEQIEMYDRARFFTVTGQRLTTRMCRIGDSPLSR